jgi:hypothetical protein
MDINYETPPRHSNLPRYIVALIMALYLIAGVAVKLIIETM